MARILDIVQHPNVGDDELAYREPQMGAGDFRLGSQVVVLENQAAVFVRDGKAMDALLAGRHTISTGNIPLLVDVLGMAFSGQTPFKAEVHFINLAPFPQVGWGTTQPLAMQTPGQGLGWLLLQGHGTMEIQVAAPRRFASSYSFGTAVVRLRDIKERLLTMVLGEMQDLIAELNPGSLMKLNSLLSELEGAMLAKLGEQFEQVGGLRLNQFDIKSLTPKTTSAEDLRNMGLLDVATYAQLQQADAWRDAANQPGGASNLAALGIAQSGQAMAQMQQMQAMQMQQQLQPTPTQQPAAPKTPKTREEIEEFLDNLDLRLANGEISEATYDRLAAKWQKKLDQLG